MFRLIRVCLRLTLKTSISCMNRSKPLTIRNIHGTCSIAVKTPGFKSKDDNLFENNDGEENSEDLKALFKARHPQVRNVVAKIIHSYGDKIEWDEVISKSLEECNKFTIEREFVKSVIVAICEKEKRYDTFTSFFKYLIKKKELNEGTFVLFCRFIQRYQEHLKPCVDIVYKIFLKLPPQQVNAQEICCSVLLNSKTHREKVLQNYSMVVNVLENKYQVIRSSLKYNDEKTAFDYLKSFKPHECSRVITYFLKYFQKIVAEGIVPFSKFVTLYDVICTKNADLTEHEKKLLKDLFASLNKIDESHMWLFSKSNIKRQKLNCPICGGKLKKCSVSDKEMGILKEYFRENVIFQENINIRTNQDEWNRFMALLNKKPYDITLDGLNIMYCLKRDASLFMQLIKEIEKLDLTPLIFGRDHFWSSSEYSALCKKYPIFLTQNVSHDDVFILYAAFHKNCYAVSRDQMGFARSNIHSADVEDIFHRWQTSHQCNFTIHGKLELPLSLLPGHQKSSSETEGEFRYHAIEKDGLHRNVYCISRLKRCKKTT